METQTVFIIYLTIFRMAIICAGVTSIILGYKLFVRGVFRPASQSDAEGQNVVAEIAGARFTLRNAAPGTCFSLFGAIIIAVMFLTGGPEGTFEALQNGESKTILRGENDPPVQTHVQLALEQLKQSKTPAKLIDFADLKSVVGFYEYDETLQRLENTRDGQ